MTKHYVVCNELANHRVVSTHRTMKGALRGERAIQPKERGHYVPCRIAVLDHRPAVGSFVAKDAGKWDAADRDAYERACYEEDIRRGR